MKKLLRYGLIAVLFLFLLIGGLLTYVSTALPNVGPAPEMHIELTPQRIARGEYLANHVMQCMECHAVRDFSLFAGPPIPGTGGAGGDVFGRDFGFPGEYVAKNITPYGVGDWTDGELYRAITTGVSKDGKALFPIMPYPRFGTSDPEDIKSVIAYIRTLEPIEKDVEPSVSDFPMNFIINTMPDKFEPTALPNPEDRLAYGAYITNASLCGDCHTKTEKGEVVGEPYAGGFEFKLPGNTIIRSANITPDEETGIGLWTREEFIERFKHYDHPENREMKVKPGSFQTIMPWMTYSGMTEQDLGAIYDYLRTVKPVKNTVKTFQAGKK